MHNAILVLFLLLFANSCDKGNDPKPDDNNTNKGPTYINPVFEPVIADPTVLDNRERDGYFYVYGTQDNWGTTPETERIVPIIRSQDLVNWEDVGDAFSAQADWNLGENLFWAPHAEYRNGKYYLYYSLSVWDAKNSALGVAVADSPSGPFTDLGKILDSNGSGVPNSIDPFVFHESDDKMYMVWGSFHGIYVAPLESDGKTPRLNEKFKIAGNAFEAAYIYKRNNYYFFFASVGSCCDGVNSSYHVTVARATSLSGPYLDINGNDINNAMDWNYGNNDIKNVNALYSGRNIIGPGHHSQIVSDDEGMEWILYHGILKSQPNLPNGAPRRPLMLDKITWDSNDWPKIGNNGYPSEYETEAPVFNQK